MYSALVAIGEVLTALQINNMRKDAVVFSGDEINFTYDDFGRLSTIEHVDVGLTHTITYERDNRIASITDGSEIWDFNYNAKNQLTSIVKQ